MNDTELLKNTWKSVKYSHPVASCPVARSLYFKWTEVDKKDEPAQFRAAGVEYKRHVAKCAVCQGGLKNE